MANSADPDQTPSSEACDLRVHFFCSSLSVRILGVNILI